MTMNKKSDLSDNLLETFLGMPTPSTNKVENINSQDYHNLNEVYQLPVQVGKNGMAVDNENPPWIVGYFSPNAPTDKNHKFHNGVDLKAPKGNPIYPIASGIVKETGMGNKSGNYVSCLHENGHVQSFYAHLDSINVRVGQVITPTTILGKVGESGNAAGRGAHCHIECKINGSLINLLSIIGKPVGSLSKKAGLLSSINKIAKIYYDICKNNIY